VKITNLSEKNTFPNFPNAPICIRYKIKMSFPKIKICFKKVTRYGRNKCYKKVSKSNKDFELKKKTLAH